MAHAHSGLGPLDLGVSAPQGVRKPLSSDSLDGETPPTLGGSFLYTLDHKDRFIKRWHCYDRRGLDAAASILSEQLDLGK
jgi:hypothetical protein